METTPFDTLGLTDEQVKIFQEIADKLEATCSATFDNDCKLSFEGFQLFADYNGFDTNYAIDIDNHKGETYITFTMVEYHFSGGRGGGSGTEYQTWGITTLQNNFGRILIKPETFTDKIREFIHPVELDFADDPQFSDKFYVLTDDKDKTLSMLNGNFRNAISDIETDDFMIEIRNNVLIIGDRKIVNTDSAVAFAKFLNKVSGMR